MTEQDRFVAYRLERARMSLETAELLYSNERYHDVYNRLYYAGFYAVSALLLYLGYSAKTHSGLRSLFNQHVIIAGLLPKEYSDIYNDLIEAREETDYEDLVEPDQAILGDWLPQVKRFIDAIDQLIQERLQG